MADYRIKRRPKGKSMDELVNKDEFIQVIYDCGGLIKDIALKTKYSKKAIYDYLDVHPELEEHRQRALGHFDESEVETCYDLLKDFVKDSKLDKEYAFKSAKLILENSKKSVWKKARNTDTVDGQKAGVLNAWESWLDDQRNKPKPLPPQQPSEPHESNLE